MSFVSISFCDEKAARVMEKITAKDRRKEKL
jgi:hypothetical protein